MQVFGVLDVLVMGSSDEIWGIHERLLSRTFCVRVLVGLDEAFAEGRGTLGRASRRNGMQDLSDQRTRRSRRVKKGNVEDLQDFAAKHWDLSHAERTTTTSWLVCSPFSFPQPALLNTNAVCRTVGCVG